jgi:hypothetical protein
MAYQGGNRRIQASRLITKATTTQEGMTDFSSQMYADGTGWPGASGRFNARHDKQFKIIELPMLKQ